MLILDLLDFSCKIGYIIVNFHLCFSFSAKVRKPSDLLGESSKPIKSQRLWEQAECTGVAKSIPKAKKESPQEEGKS